MGDADTTLQARLAGAGYVAIMIDFHGSTGYGQAFTDSISGDWGGKPLEDLKKGLAFAAEKYPFVDENRACALGASYGSRLRNRRTYVLPGSIFSVGPGIE